MKSYRRLNRGRSVFPDSRALLKALYLATHDLTEKWTNVIRDWYFPEPYRRQKGWERIRNDNEPDNSMDGFQEIPTEEMEQLGLPEEWLKQK